MGKKNRNTNKALKALKRRSSYRRGGKANIYSEFEVPLNPDGMRGGVARQQPPKQPTRTSKTPDLSGKQPSKQPIRTSKTPDLSGTSRSGLGGLGFTDDQVAAALKNSEAKTVSSNNQQQRVKYQPTAAQAQQPKKIRLTPEAQASRGSSFVGEIDLPTSPAPVREDFPPGKAGQEAFLAAVRAWAGGGSTGGG